MWVGVDDKPASIAASMATRCSSIAANRENATSGKLTAAEMDRPSVDPSVNCLNSKCAFSRSRIETAETQMERQGTLRNAHASATSGCRSAQAGNFSTWFAFSALALLAFESEFPMLSHRFAAALKCRRLAQDYALRQYLAVYLRSAVSRTNQDASIHRHSSRNLSNQIVYNSS